jgi:hypothetical protein
MAGMFEIAPTARAKCRGCGLAIERGALRFGERIPNPFGGGEATLWFHPPCAAFRRPEPLLEALPNAPEELADRDELARVAHASAAHRRLPRVDGAERAPGGQAMCRHCRQPIEKGTWRIRLVIYDEGQFAKAGFIHLACRTPYFEGHDVLEPLLHFSPQLADDERKDLTRRTPLRFRSAPASAAEVHAALTRPLLPCARAPRRMGRCFHRRTPREVLEPVADSSPRLARRRAA